MRVAELTVVVLTALYGLRVLLKPPFRRDLAEQPRVAIGLGLLAVVAVGVGTWAVVRWPLLLHLAALAALSGLAAAWWRARPTYGRGRRWPPGSLGVGASLDAIGDRAFYLDQARIHGPVFKMSQFGRPVVCVVGLGRGRDLMRENKGELAAASLPYNRLVPKGSLRYMSAEDHLREGRLFRSTLSSIDLASHEDAMRATCRTMLARLATDSGRCESGARPREYAGGWAFTALADVFFGLGPDDVAIGTLDGVQRALKLDRGGGLGWRRKLEDGFSAGTELLREKASAGAKSGSGRSSSNVLAALLLADPSALDDETRAKNLLLIFRLAVADLSSLLDWVFKKLSEHPEWQEQVRSAPSTRGGQRGTRPSDIATRVVLETIRLEQSEYLYRSVVRPIEIEGFAVPAGWLLRICVQESHRDPVIFPDADTFDPDRFSGRTVSGREYSPFGLDEHGCMGVSMVHFCCRIFVEELCHGHRWRVTHDGPLERGTRHRDHWRPSSATRVVFDSAADG